MRKLEMFFLAMIAVFLFTIPSLASESDSSGHQVVSYHAQVATALDPYNQDCQVNAGHYNDVVNSCHAGQVAVNAYAVSDPAYSNASYNAVVKMVGAQQVSTKQVQVIVRRGIFARLGFTGFNQTVVNCVQTTKVNGKVVKQVVVRRNRVFGFLVGNNSRRVKFAVAACR